MGELEGVFQGLDIATSALRAEQARAEIVAANLANVHSTGNRQREPYRRQGLVFEELLRPASPGLQAMGVREMAGGVQVARVYEDRDTAFVSRYEPGHPDADERGFVLGSNVDLMREMVEMMAIERSFQANVAAMHSYRTMLRNSITQIGR